MATESGHGPADLSWFVAPGESDSLAWISIGLILLALYGIVTLYAAFDRWAEHSSKGTPLARTIPTLLAIALLYEIFPLEHFNILLPISAILIALMADWSRYNLRGITQAPAEASAATPPTPAPAQGTGAPAASASEGGEHARVAADVVSRNYPLLPAQAAR